MITVRLKARLSRRHIPSRTRPVLQVPPDAGNAQILPSRSIASRPSPATSTEKFVPLVKVTCAAATPATQDNARRRTSLST